MQEQPRKPQDVGFERPINGARRDGRTSVEAPANDGRGAHTPRPHPPVEEPEGQPEEHAPENEPDGDSETGSDQTRRPPRPGKAPR